MTSLPERLTVGEATVALAALRQEFAASKEPVWQVDAAPVKQLDTSALAVLLECARMAGQAGRRLEIVGMPARLCDLAHLYGVDGLLGLPAQPGQSGGVA